MNHSLLFHRDRRRGERKKRYEVLREGQEGVDASIIPLPRSLSSSPGSQSEQTKPGESSSTGAMHGSYILRTMGRCCVLWIRLCPHASTSVRSVQNKVYKGKRDAAWKLKRLRHLSKAKEERTQRQRREQLAGCETLSRQCLAGFCTSSLCSGSTAVTATIPNANHHHIMHACVLTLDSHSRWQRHTPTPSFPVASFQATKYCLFHFKRNRKTRVVR